MKSSSPNIGSRPRQWWQGVIRCWSTARTWQRRKSRSCPCPWLPPCRRVWCWDSLNAQNPPCDWVAPHPRLWAACQPNLHWTDCGSPRWCWMLRCLETTLSESSRMWSCQCFFPLIQATEWVTFAQVWDRVVAGSPCQARIAHRRCD